MAQLFDLVLICSHAKAQFIAILKIVLLSHFGQALCVTWGTVMNWKSTAYRVVPYRDGDLHTPQQVCLHCLLVYLKVSQLQLCFPCFSITHLT